ncbi:MAG: hypothetical protein GC161_07060 [Planctomycetaceae bacterium]|nr:hypothetical protein [Planctomycetaceae bacterium]
MSPWVLGFGLCAALAPALALHLVPEFSASFEGVRLAAYTWCVGAVFLSLPRACRAADAADAAVGNARALLRAALLVALFLPPLALALALDRAVSLGLDLALCAALVAGWLALAAAAELARARARLVTYAALWFGLLLAPPLLRASLLWAGRPGTAAGESYAAWGEAFERLARVSPFGWVWEVASSAASPALADALGPVLVLAALLVAASAPRRGTPRAPRHAARHASLLAAAVCLVPAARAENRLHWAELELRGPLDRVTLTLQRGGSTELALDLGPGQNVRMEVPLPYRSDLDRQLLPPPEIAAQGGGDAQWVQWEQRARESAGSRDPWRNLPRGLTARPRPAPEQRRPGPAAAALLLAGFAAAVGLWALVRDGRTSRGGRSSRGGPLVPVAAVVLGSGAAALLLGPLATPEPGGNRVRALDLQGADGLALLAERGTLDPEDADVLRLEVRPADADLRFVARPAPGAARARWRAVDPAGVLEFCAFAAVPPGTAYLAGTADLAGERNPLGDLTGAFWRAPAGAWYGPWTWQRGAPPPPDLAALAAGGTASARGPLGDPPGSDAAAEALVLRRFPGWLVGGLPQGVGVLVGGLEPGPDGAPRWLRLYPFP